MQQNRRAIDEYNALIKKVDALQKKVVTRYKKAISCRKGCSSCCILETVFPIEAASIERALANLTKTSLKTLARQMQKALSGECVFLVRDQCLIYKQRPIICRTHGLPLIIDGKIDFCEKNFKGVASIDGPSVLDLERTTMILAAMNMRFLQETQSATRTSARIALRDIVARFI